MTVTVIDGVEEISEDRTGVMFRASENISFDIETTGLDVDDKITVFGFYPDANDALMMLNAGGSSKSAESIADELEQYTTDDINLIVVQNEHELLKEHLVKFSNRLDNKDQGFQRLCGYNVETWGGGFDLPFIRTRCIKNDISWFLTGQYVADVFPEVKKYLHTTTQKVKLSTVETDSDEDDYQTVTSNGLDEAHEMLCGCNTQDVFDDSKEATTRYNDEDFAAVLAHCYFDVKRTNCMLDMLLEYSPHSVPSEFKDSGFI